jgi:hypothetical protein
MPDDKTVGRNAGKAGFEFAVHPTGIRSRSEMAFAGQPPHRRFGILAPRQCQETPGGAFFRRIDRQGLIVRV